MRILFGGQIGRGISRIEIGRALVSIGQPHHPNRSKPRNQWPRLMRFFRGMSNPLCVHDFRQGHFRQRSQLEMFFHRHAEQVAAQDGPLLF